MSRELEIAVGVSRKTKTWKNTKMQWQELAGRLSQCTRTAETMAEYRAMGREQQSDIKDCGGFVGGYCPDGNRSRVVSRSILTLDADFAEPTLWDDFGDLFGYTAAAVYSTHKHTPEKPRLRLVVPMARDVSPDEYQAIGRMVAKTLGIDQFDDTSYQPQRLMYWPSASRDAEFFFKAQNGDMLDPDDILGMYRDWTDISSWPMSSRVADITKRSAAKQQDPLEKKGLVGAFCRAYSIREAIAEFVPVYAPCDDGRYTYTEGSTAAGVVIYEDKFSFSNHATDPASSQLCNAWDLVRLHRFGLMDDGIDPGTRVDHRPSYKAMCDFAGSDSRVIAQTFTDRAAQARDDFADPVTDGADWKGKLRVTDKGVPAQTIENVVTVLTHDPALAGRLAYNEMSGNIEAVQSLPWRTAEVKKWTDADDASLRLYMEQLYGLQGKDRIFDGVNIVAQRNSYHPVREYLDSCSWDGVPRVDSLLIDYLGAEDNEYTRAVTRKTLVAAVARIYRPGCKFDYMLTFRGVQGLGKSSLLGKLGGEWFSDTFGVMQGKEAYEQIQGSWIIEVGELASMRKAEVETVKLFLSKKSDRFRPAYGRRLQEFPRQCIFVGTTNESQFLRDTTGNRRFWVVDTPDGAKKDMWKDLTSEEVSQIWGEAVQLFKDGETLYLSKQLEEQARAVQECYEEDNPRVGLVADYLDRLLPEDWYDMTLYDRRHWLEGDNAGSMKRDTVCSMEIWAEALGGNPDKIDRYVMAEIRSILAKLPGWRPQGTKQITVRPYGRQRFYRRVE